MFFRPIQMHKNNKENKNMASQKRVLGNSEDISALLSFYGWDQISSSPACQLLGSLSNYLPVAKIQQLTYFVQVWVFECMHGGV